MPEENVVATDAANRRWKRLMPLLLLLAGFGAGVLASAVPGSCTGAGSTA